MVKTLFSQFGETGKVNIMRDRRGISKDFGFVEMPEAEAAGSAINGLNGKVFYNRTLDINQQAAPPRAGHGGNKMWLTRFRR